MAADIEKKVREHAGVVAEAMMVAPDADAQEDDL
jgi:recombination protein RecA